MDPLKTLLNSGYDRAKKGEYNGALDEFKVVLANNPNHAGALFGAAACHYRLENPEEARALLERLLDIHSQHPEGLQLLRKLQMEGLGSKGVSYTKEDPLNPEYSSLDPFGTGLDKPNREIEILPEWQSPGREVPSARETLLEGRGEGASPFSVGRAYSEAWKVYRKDFKRLFWGGWICVFIGLGILTPVLPWIAASYQAGNLITPFKVILLTALYPLLGIYSGYCFRHRVEGRLPLTEIPQFVRYYPDILFCSLWMLVPVPFLMAGIYGVSLLIDLVTGIPLVEWIYGHVPAFTGACYLYVWWRSWFLNQAVYSDPDLHPLTILGKAFFATSDQHLRLMVFTILQILFLIPGLLFFGLGLPLVHLAQTEAFLQTQESKRAEGVAEDKIGFVPKGAGSV